METHHIQTLTMPFEGHAQQTESPTILLIATKWSNSDPVRNTKSAMFGKGDDHFSPYDVRG